MNDEFSFTAEGRQSTKQQRVKVSKGCWRLMSRVDPQHNAKRAGAKF
jgi:hypothetical protein